MHDNYIIDLINSDMEIDDNDEDFKCMLKSIKRTSSNDADNLNPIGLKTIEKNINCDAIEFECYKNNECKEQEYNTETIFNSKYHGCSQRPYESGIPCAVKNGRHQEIFPEILFRMLEESNASGHSHIISWLPHGHAFKIHDKNMFEENVLKNYFNSTFDSFKRQLYIYGFKKAGKQSTDFGAYYHDQFICGQKKMSSRIDKWKKKESAFETINPNFDIVPTTLNNMKK